MRNRYWSCSPFADWLRGTAKPYAETWEGWDDWRKHAELNHRVRYWLAEEALDKVQDVVNFIPDKLYAIKYYINNRWITRSHSCTAHPRDIRPGQWQDVGYRFLPCLFNELVDYVEIELAWQQILWNKKEAKKYNAPFWATGWFRWRTWRCPEAGLDNLKWQSELVWEADHCQPGSKNINKPTHQAITAKEILELYHWWTEIYPNRPDPSDASGWTAICEELRQKGQGVSIFRTTKDKDLKKRERAALNNLSKIEDAYDKEEDRMLVKLVNIRRSLWT